MKRRAFTLIELLLALAASAVLLAAIYGVMSRAIHLRDNMVRRLRETAVRERAAAMLRDDLRHARISGGTLDAEFIGSQTAQGSNFPGDLKFTATNGRDDLDENGGGDAQEIEYYVENDPANPKAGALVRSVNRNLLATTQQTPAPQAVLPGVSAMELSFYDGQNWNDSWTASADDPTLPEAVRVTLRFAAPEDGSPAPAPIEIFVPWITQPAVNS